jgi:hypothetical protein
MWCKLGWILDEILARFATNDDAAHESHVSSWRRHQGSICHPVEFELRVKTQTGDPGQAMVASSNVILFLEVLL